MTEPNGEYLAVNRPSIEAVRENMDANLASRAGLIVVRASINQDLYFATGEPDAELMQQRSWAEIDDETAEELAKVRSESLLASAKIELLTLGTMVTMKRYAESWRNASDAEKASMSLANFPLFQYENAQCESVGWQAGESLYVHAVKASFDSAESDEVASMYKLVVSDGELLTELALSRIDGDMEQVMHEIKLVSDPLLRRVITTLGFRGIILLLNSVSGTFESEDDLDQSLSDVWLDYIGTALEDEVGPLLDEVRVRSMAAKDNLEFHRVFRSDLPDGEQWKKLIEISAVTDR